MKYIKNFENLILELGDAGALSYDIDNYLEMSLEDGSKIFNYFFTTDSGLRYAINLTTNVTFRELHYDDIENCMVVDDEPEEFLKKLMLISFVVVNGEDEDLSEFVERIITNRGELYRIMSTLKKVIEEFLNKRKDIKYIFVGGARTEKDIDKEQREKIYLKYFEKHKPNWKKAKIYCNMMDDFYYIFKIK
jgi:hypothetical protein